MKHFLVGLVLGSSITLAVAFQQPPGGESLPVDQHLIDIQTSMEGMNRRMSELESWSAATSFQLERVTSAVEATEEAVRDIQTCMDCSSLKATDILLDRYGWPPTQTDLQDAILIRRMKNHLRPFGRLPEPQEGEATSDYYERVVDAFRAFRAELP